MAWTPVSHRNTPSKPLVGETALLSLDVMEPERRVIVSTEFISAALADFVDCTAAAVPPTVSSGALTSPGRPLCANLRLQRTCSGDLVLVMTEIIRHLTDRKKSDRRWPSWYLGHQRPCSPHIQLSLRMSYGWTFGIVAASLS